MNFFGIEISDEQFEAGLNVARFWLKYPSQYSGEEATNKAIGEALGFEAGDVAAPPAESDSRKTIVSKSDINRES